MFWLRNSNLGSLCFSQAVTTTVPGMFGEGLSEGPTLRVNPRLVWTLPYSGMSWLVLTINLTQLRIMGERISVEESLRSGWSLGMSVEDCLDY